MRILGSVIAPSTTLMSSCDSKITGSGSIRPQIVRDQLVSGILLHWRDGLRIAIIMFAQVFNQCAKLTGAVEVNVVF
jgi:hypothetical protein